MNELEAGFRAHWRGYLIGIVAALLAFYYLFLRKVPGTATAPAKSGAGAGYLIQPGTTSGGGSVDTGNGGADATAQLQDFLKQATDSLTQLSASQVAALQSAAQQQLSNMTAAQQAAQQAAASQLAQEQTLSQQIMSMLKTQGTVPSGASLPTDAQATQWAQSLGIPAGWGIQYKNETGSLAPDIPTLNAWLNAKGYRNPSTGNLNFGTPTPASAGPDVAGWAAGLGVPISEGQAFVQSVGRLPQTLQEWVSFRNAHGWAN